LFEAATSASRNLLGAAGFIPNLRRFDFSADDAVQLLFFPQSGRGAIVNGCGVRRAFFNFKLAVMVGLAFSAVGRGSGSAQDLPGRLFAVDRPQKPGRCTRPTIDETLGFDFTPEVSHTRVTPVNGTKGPVPVANPRTDNEELWWNLTRPGQD
jgi:hypothetical protein